MKKILLLIIIIASFVYFYKRKQSSVKINKNQLLVGLSADYQPFAFIKDRTIVGFDIDVLQEISKRLKKELVIRDIPFDMLIPEIQIGSLHLLASGMSETPLRAKKVLFTRPYYQGDPLLLITPTKKARAITSVQDLADLDIVVNDGYTADSYLTALQEPCFRLHRLKTPAESFLALKTGKADVYVIAKSAAQPFLQDKSNQEYTISVLPNTGDSYSFAISKKHPEILLQVQKALDAIAEDGTLEAIKKKWNFT